MKLVFLGTSTLRLGPSLPSTLHPFFSCLCACALPLQRPPWLRLALGEFQDAFKGLGLGLAPNQVDGIFDHLDCDGDGEVTVREFDDACVKRLHQNQRPRRKQANAEEEQQLVEHSGGSASSSGRRRAPSPKADSGKGLDWAKLPLLTIQAAALHTYVKKARYPDADPLVDRAWLKLLAALKAKPEGLHNFLYQLDHDMDNTICEPLFTY